MNLLRVLLVAALIVTLGSCGGPATTTTTASSGTGYEWRRLCSTLGAPGSDITRAQFLGVAKDREAAAQVFDACDVDRSGVLTEKEAAANPIYFENLKSQVIQFHTPR